VCTTLKAEEHPDEIHKKNPRYLPMKNQPNSIFFQAFLEEKKRTKKNLPRSSSNNYTEENGCAYGFVFGKTKQTKRTRFSSVNFSSNSNFRHIFSHYN